jgi:hypothetical protein
MQWIGLCGCLLVACGRSEIEDTGTLTTVSTDAAAGSSTAADSASGTHAASGTDGADATPDAACTWGFAPLASHDAGQAPVAIAIGDLNGDGHLDLAVNNYGGGPNGLTLNTLRNIGDGTYAPWKSYVSAVAFSMAAGHFVSDASTDLLVGCLLFPNQGDGVFASAVS